MMNKTTKQQALTRLKRAEGQIAGIRRMVEEDKYCVDILIQLSAAQAALGQVARLVLEQHISCCVRDAFASGSDDDRQQKIQELLDVFTRYARPGAK